MDEQRPGQGNDPSAENSPKRGIETRRAIETAALKLFAELGYHGTAMRSVASEARVQAPAIYHWYKSKEDLLVFFQNDFMEQLNEQVVPAIERHKRPIFQLAAAVRAHVVFHAENTRAAFVTDSEIRALNDGRKQELIQKRDAYQDLFYDLVVAGISDGSLSTPNPRVATYALLLECTGVALWFDESGPLGPEEVADIHIRLVLGSLGAPDKAVRESIEATALEADQRQI